MLKVRLLSKTAKLPTKSSPLSAGYDLYSTARVVIPPNESAEIPTGLQMEFPEGCYGRIASRSKLAADYKVGVDAGVVDADYRGAVVVLLRNYSSQHRFIVNIGDKVAQIICTKIEYPQLVQVDRLEDTERGSRGMTSKAH